MTDNWPEYTLDCSYAPARQQWVIRFEKRLTTTQLQFLIEQVLGLQLEHCNMTDISDINHTDIGLEIDPLTIHQQALIELTLELMNDKD